MQTSSPQQVHNPSCVSQRLCHSVSVRVENEHAPSDDDGADAVPHVASHLHLHLQIMSICKARDKPFKVCPYFSPVFIYSVFLMLVEGADIISLDKEFYTSTTL